ncbi:hypothetical protein Tco_1383415 [Tanacetum coccineum]
MGRGLLGPNSRSCGGKGGKGGSMAGRGGGWITKRSIESKEGYGSGGLAVLGGKSSSELKNGLLASFSGGYVFGFGGGMARAICFLENHDVGQHPINVYIPLVLLGST